MLNRLRPKKWDMINPSDKSTSSSDESTEETNVFAQAIDLGLPSGTKWASCNVGATKPEEYGELFAWGETSTKRTFSDRNYKLPQSSVNDISGTKYDVAHVKWGGGWRMPTKAQIEELAEKCKVSQTSINGVKGVLVKGPNGRSIFLPAAGAQWITHGVCMVNIGHLRFIPKMTVRSIFLLLYLMGRILEYLIVSLTLACQSVLFTCNFRLVHA